MEPSSLSRRHAMQFATAAAASTFAKPAFARFGQENLDLGKPKTPLDEFGYDSVSLEAGLHETQLKDTVSVIMSLDDASLLRPYRERAGLPYSGDRLGGWYNSQEFFIYNILGQWISGLARYYAISRDARVAQKVSSLIDGLQDVLSSGHDLFRGTPADYVYEKLSCGLLDAYQYCGLNSAARVLTELTQLAIPILPAGADQCLAEGYKIPEYQLVARKLGLGSVHEYLAKRFTYSSFFEPLAKGQNVLAGRHAYSHVDALCSAAALYIAFGDPRMLAAAENGLAFVEKQSFATGGWGPDETFVPNDSVKSLAESLSETHWHFETVCGAYAHVKLCRYLLRITANPHYGDSMERIIYNTVLGARPLQSDGRSFYQSDYSCGAYKTYFDGYGGTIPSEYPCCAGSLPQIASDYRKCIYFIDNHKLYVNLYIPSSVSYHEGNIRNVSIMQTGHYLEDGEVEFRFSCEHSTSKHVYFRVPETCSSVNAHVNGESVVEKASPGEWLVIARRWSNNDTVNLKFSFNLKIEPLDNDRHDLVAITYGPLVLFAIGDRLPKVTRDQLLTASRGDGRSLEWSVTTAEGSIRLVPFWAIHGKKFPPSDRYSTYFELLS